MHESNQGNTDGIAEQFVIFIPILTLLLFRIRSSLNQWAAVFISVAGLWFLTGHFKQVNQGDLITVISAISYAGHIIFTDKFIKKDLDPYVLSFQQFAVVGIVSLLLSLIIKAPLTLADSSVFWWVLYLAVFPSLIACVIQPISQRLVDPIKTGLTFSLEPVFAAAFAWIFGRESLTMSQIVGGLLIFIAIIFSRIYKSSHVYSY